MSESTIVYPPYIYQPLTGDRNVRVLEVDGADSYKSDLTFRIVEASLDSPPEYYAISYCWEGQMPSRTVLCEDRTLLITVNCEAALKQFRRQQNETILLWIDAICINQADEAVRERNHQVLMMGDVYKTANQVWVWLGSDRLQALPKIAYSMLKWMRDLGAAAGEPDTSKQESTVVEKALQIQHQDMCYIEDFVLWFKRIWIVQEVLLAKSAVLHRDEIEIDFSGLLLARDTITEAAKIHPGLVLLESRLRVSLSIFYRLERVMKGSKSVSQLFDASSSTHYHYCSDPRDKVFSLYSLWIKAGLSLPPPDYTTDTETVYRRTAKALMYHDGRGIDTLLYICSVSKRPNFSSWSPDFNTMMDAYPFFPSAKGEDQRFRASGESLSEISFSDNDLYFLCRGRVLESLSIRAELSLAHIDERLGEPESYLTWTYNAQPREGFWKELLTTAPEMSKDVLSVWNIHVLRSFVDFASLTKTSSHREADVLEDVRSSFLGYIGRISYDMAAPYLQKREIWTDWCDNILQESGERVPASEETRHAEVVELEVQENVYANSEIRHFQDVKHKLQHSEASHLLRTPTFKAWEKIGCSNDQAGLHRAITVSTRYQTLFRTSSTNSLGMAPHSVRVGDQIALLAGLNRPMVIRPLESGHYRIIAPAYACGMMYGEAWDEAWNDGEGLEELVFE